MVIEHRVIQSRAGQPSHGTRATDAHGELSTHWAGRDRHPTFTEAES